MFLRCKRRKKDGKDHRYWSVVENRRVATDAWCSARCCTSARSTTASARPGARPSRCARTRAERRQVALFPAGPCHAPALTLCGGAGPVSELRLRRPRQWGACWLALQLWRPARTRQLLAPAAAAQSREGHPLAEGAQDAGGLPPDRSGQRMAAAPAVVRRTAPWPICWARTSRWPRRTRSTAAWTSWWSTRRRSSRTSRSAGATCFGAKFDVLLYDLTSTYFESDPPADRGQAPVRLQPRQATRLRAGGHRADRHARGLPAGLRSDGRQHRRQARPCADFLTQDRSALRQGQAHLGDGPRHPHRGHPGRRCAPVDPPVHYLVGTPKGG